MHVEVVCLFLFLYSNILLHENTTVYYHSTVDECISLLGLPQMNITDWWLTQQKFILSQFWRLEVLISRCRQV